MVSYLITYFALIFILSFIYISFVTIKINYIMKAFLKKISLKKCIYRNISIKISMETMPTYKNL